MPVSEWEKTFTCPYNPAHQITVERIQWHLVKCRKNHQGSDMVVCPFNTSHHVPKPEEQYHIRNCPDRRMVEMEKYRMGNRHHLPLFLPSEQPELPPSGEDWEAEATIAVSYNPSVHASKTAVLRKLEGATKSQRREFRVQEQQRLEDLGSREGARRERLNSETSLGGRALRRPVLDSRPASFPHPSLPGAPRSSQLRRPSGLGPPASLNTSASSFCSTTADVDSLDQAIQAAGRLSLRSEVEAPRPLRRPSIGPVEALRRPSTGPVEALRRPSTGPVQALRRPSIGLGAVGI